MEIGGVEVDLHGGGCRSSSPTSEGDVNMDLRRGPWTVEEDLVLINYIANHGKGRWNSLAHCAGLNRTGKSCRLRWLNYLRPDVRRGNITPEEQLLILELHSRWGNRWSKIAQNLPGRTDNEIKNYWRTRVQKHAKQLKCDVNSKQFKDVMRYLWMPRLLERIQGANQVTEGTYPNPSVHVGGDRIADAGCVSGFRHVNPKPEYSGGPGSSFECSSVGTHLSSPVTVTTGNCDGGDRIQAGQSTMDAYWPESLASPVGYPHLGLPDTMDWWSGGDLCENLWSMEDNWLIQQQQQQI